MTKLDQLKDGYTNEIGKYKLYFTTYPFKSLHISPIKQDKCRLFEFSCFEGTNRWLVSMYKTSYYQNAVYGTSLYGDDATIENVIKWVDDTLLDLQKTLNDLFQ